MVAYLRLIIKKTLAIFGQVIMCSGNSSKKTSHLQIAQIWYPNTPRFVHF
ncbi:MAG: hypothetical protein V7K69_32125 [Nostoc sp.]